MDESVRYNNLYRQSKSNVESCARNIRELERIRNSLNSDYYNRQRNVNIQLGELREELGRGIRHDSVFNRAQAVCEEHQEGTTNTDHDLRRAVEFLEQELQELSRKKVQEESRRDQYYGQYQEQRNKERQERIDRMNLFR